MSFHCPDRYRVRKGDWCSNDGDNFGAFFVPFSLGKAPLKIIATDGLDEMCFVKSLFWDEEDCVMQLHPPKSDYVNNHRFCLHLWRPVDVQIPRPSSHMVGDPSLGVLEARNEE